MKKTKTKMFDSVKAKALLFVISLVIAFCCGGWAVYVIATPPYSANIYLDDLPSPYTYTIKRDGANYSAVKYDGSIPYSGTVASTVINNAIGSGGVSICFQATSFTITLQIVLKNNTVLVGNSAPSYWYDLGGTVFINAISTTNASMIVGTNKSCINIRNMKFFGNNLGTGVNCMNMSFGTNVKLQNLQISHFTGHGIVATALSISEIDSCYIGWNGGDGIFAGYGFVDSFVTKCYLNRNNNGAHLGEGSSYIFFTDNKFEWNDGAYPDGNGIRLFGARYINVAHNTFDRNSGSGILQQQRTLLIQGLYNPCWANIYQGNIFSRNGRDRTNEFSCHIKIENSEGLVTNCTITNNVFYEGRDDSTLIGGVWVPSGPLTPIYNIVWHGTSFVKISGNDFSNGCTNSSYGLFTWSSENNAIYDNIGWITQNSGFAYVTNGDYVNHGLSNQWVPASRYCNDTLLTYPPEVGTPTTVIAVACEEGFYVQVHWVSGTQFGVNVNYAPDLTSGNATMWIYAGSPIPVYWYAEIRG